MRRMDRRQVLKILGAGGLVFLTELAEDKFGLLANRAEAAVSNPYSGGGCTEWAWSKRPDLPPNATQSVNLQDGKDWATNANGAGFYVGSSPKGDCIAVFPANGRFKTYNPSSKTDGYVYTLGKGHVAYVEAIDSPKSGVYKISSKWGPTLTSGSINYLYNAASSPYANSQIKFIHYHKTYWKGVYRSGRNPGSGSMLLVRNDGTGNGGFSQNWGPRVPASGLPVDNFAVRWRKTVNIPKAGTYNVWIKSDDGISVYIDHKQIFEKWWDHGATTCGDMIKTALSAGNHDFLIDYYEHSGNALVDLKFGIGLSCP
jgi:surface antigen